MARIRTVKPEFFRHRRLFLVEKECGLPVRLAFEGLWTCADREGRFRWRPEELKLDCLPYDDLDFEQVLAALADAGFIVKYEVDGKFYGVIPSFGEHQHINVREPKSRIPDQAGASTCKNIPAHGEGKGREGKGSAADAPPPVVPSGGHRLEIVASGHPSACTPEVELFDRGKAILGASSGGLISKLLKAKGGNIALARAALETASTKSNAREYVGALIRGRDSPEDLRARGEAW